MENLFKTPKDKEADIWTVINSSMTKIETLLNTITITSQDGKESN